MRQFVLAALALIAASNGQLRGAEPWHAVLPPGGFTFEGDFRPGGVHPGIDWPAPQNSNRSVFGTWAGDRPGTGSLRSAPFRAPSFLRFHVAGGPNMPGLDTYLEDTRTGRRLSLAHNLNPWLLWTLHKWRIPADWRGATVQLHIEDRSQDLNLGWLAITTPEAGSDGFLLPLARAAFRSLLLAFELILFLVPGIAVTLAIQRRVPLPAFRFAAATLCLAAITGYLDFQIYLVSPKAGALFSAAVFALSGIAVGWLTGKPNRLVPPPVFRELMGVLAVVLLVAALYNSLGFLYFAEDSPGEFAQRRFSSYSLPPDNLLQYMFADHLYSGISVHPFLFRDIHSSDRPPLETALTLEQRPFWRVMSPGLGYQNLGIVLQCLWVAGLWILLRAASLPPPAIAVTIGFAVFTGFCWQHSFYVWPKLLAASFGLIGVACFPFIREENRWTMADSLLAAAAFSLSLLSHAGTAFTIVSFAVFVTVRRKLPPWRMAISAVLVALALHLPWSFYQIYADPPGDAQLKLHLAGSEDPNRTLSETLQNAYGGLSVRSYLSNKAANVKALFVVSGVPQATPAKTALYNFIAGNFFAFFQTVGLLNLGLIARLWLRRTDRIVRFADRLLVISAGSLAVWCLLMFVPGSTLVHQGSFAGVLVHFAAMALYLYRFWPPVAAGLIAVQACIVFPVIVFGRPLLMADRGVVWDAPIDPGMATVAVISVAGLVLSWVAACRNREASGSELPLISSRCLQ